MPLASADRKILEGSVFEWLNQVSREKNLLYIGVAPYTHHYYHQLKYSVYTIDLNPDAARWGNYKFHTIGSALNLTEYYRKNFFDVILAYGLIGYGLNTKDDFNQLLKSCSESMVVDGILVIGYNDNQSHLNFKLSEVDSYNLFIEFTPDISTILAPQVKINIQNDATILFLKKI